MENHYLAVRTVARCTVNDSACIIVFEHIQVVKARWLLCVPHAAIFLKSEFLPQNLFISPLLPSQQQQKKKKKAIISLREIKRLVFAINK